VKVTEGKLSLRNALTLNCTKTGVEYIVVPGTEKLKETVAEQITFWEKHIDTGYMSKLIMTVLDRSDYIRFRDRGGFYFVLEKYRENINRLERFIQSVGGIELGRIGLVDEENVRNMIVDIFVQEANELQLQVNQYLEEVKSGEIKRIRKDGIETRLNELKKLREKMQRILETIDRERKDLEVSLENFEKELVMLTLEQEEV
jgi:vacuolar-type H+-ATPase subunit I/STV1